MNSVVRYYCTPTTRAGRWWVGEGRKVNAKYKRLGSRVAVRGWVEAHAFPGTFSRNYVIRGPVTSSLTSFTQRRRPQGCFRVESLADQLPPYRFFFTIGMVRDTGEAKGTEKIIQFFFFFCSTNLILNLKHFFFLVHFFFFFVALFE